MVAGERIGNFELLELIGSGGMGDVFRALDVGLERQVAVKILKPALASDAHLSERFREEAKTLAQLQHPNITQLYDLVEDRGRLGMSMEFAEGETLEDYLHRRGPLPFERAMKLFLQCLDAFDCAHRLGIVHRDIKPANVMICGQDRIKVMDFGVARILGSARHTIAGQMVGTPRYMSPEQIVGGEVDPRSDIYCLGILLFEMLTGEPPFRRGSDFAVMRSQVEEMPASPSLLRTGLPDSACRLVLRALAKSPGDRFQSAAEFRAECARCLENPEEPVMPLVFESVDSRLQPPPPQERSQWWKYAAAVVAVAIAVAGAVGYQGSTQAAPSPSKPVAAAVCPDPPATPKEAPFEIGAGAPLTRREVVLLLQVGTPAARLAQVIEKRGVEFVNGAESAAEILKAGGTHELNGLIALNQRPAVPDAAKPMVRPPAIVAQPKPPAAAEPSALQGQSLLHQ